MRERRREIGERVRESRIQGHGIEKVRENERETWGRFSERDTRDRVRERRRDR